MLISILTPVYNGAKYLDELIKSVLCQTHCNYEHILIDDGSTDDGATRSILMKYPHLKWWSRANRGQYNTQNELVQVAKGDIVTVICADDLYTSRLAFENVCRCFDSYPEVDVVYGHTFIMRSTSDMTIIFNPHLRGAIAFRLAKYIPTVQHCSLFVKRELIIKKNLFFDGNLRMRGDWDWILRIIEATKKVAYLDEPIAYWRHHETQTSRTQIECGCQEARLVCQKHGINYRVHLAAHSVFAKYGLYVALVAIVRQHGIGQLIRTLKKRILAIGIKTYR